MNPNSTNSRYAANFLNLYDLEQAYKAGPEEFARVANAQLECKDEDGNSLISVCDEYNNAPREKNMSSLYQLCEDKMCVPDGSKVRDLPDRYYYEL
jgi:hypothetical protein